MCVGKKQVWSTILEADLKLSEAANVEENEDATIGMRDVETSFAQAVRKKNKSKEQKTDTKKKSSKLDRAQLFPSKRVYDVEIGLSSIKW